MFIKAKQEVGHFVVVFIVDQIETPCCIFVEGHPRKLLVKFT